MSDDPETNDSTALHRGVRVGRAAAELGFDWERAVDALDKVAEEVAELRDALEMGDHDACIDELGDLLFAVCNVARKEGIDPEHALHRGVSKFETRFSALKAAVRASGRTVEEMTLEELEDVWQSVK